MNPSEKNPKDQRMRSLRKKIRHIGRDLSILRHYLKDRVPYKHQREFQQQLQRAFDAGRAYSEVQNTPQSLPVDEKGQLRIGPALRYHILETRKVYGDVDQLREIVADLFDEKSEKMLNKLLQEQEEQLSGTGTTEIEV
jgi:hypothetical protein